MRSGFKCREVKKKAFDLYRSRIQQDGGLFKKKARLARAFSSPKVEEIIYQLYQNPQTNQAPARPASWSADDHLPY